MVLHQSSVRLLLTSRPLTGLASWQHIKAVKDSVQVLFVYFFVSFVLLVCAIKEAGLVHDI